MRWNSQWRLTVYCAAVIGLIAAGDACGRGRTIRVGPGYDWALPKGVPPAPYSGYITFGHKWLHRRARKARYRDGHVHFASFVIVPWSQINPADGVYDWAPIDKKIKAITSVRGVGFILHIQGYAKKDSETGVALVPEWLVKKGTVQFLPNGAVAAWAPGSEYQKYFGLMLRKLGQRYRNHPLLIGVDMRGLDPIAGEWCWRGGPALMKKAWVTTHLTPLSFRTWGLRFIEDFVVAFEGRESRLAWPGATDSILFGEAFRPAARALWQAAYNSGCGGRDSEGESWNRYLDVAHGIRRTRDGHLLVDQTFAPIRDGRIWYAENDDYYFHSGKGRYGSGRYAHLRWFISTLRALQMRRNWVVVPNQRRVFARLEDQHKGFVHWLERSLGKTAATSADAWCWLQEGYLPGFGIPRQVKNIERWLFQRDIAPDGLTMGAVKVNVAGLGQQTGRTYEYHARRTDLMTDSPCIYFRTDRAFLAGGPHKLELYVTYVDGPDTQWCIEYAGLIGPSRTQSIRTYDLGTLHTAVFEIPDMHFRGSFANSMDFRIVALGREDATIKLVRIVKPGQL